MNPDLEYGFDKRRFRFVVGLYPIIDAWINLRYAAEGAKTAKRLENPHPHLRDLEYLMDHINELTK